MAILSQAERNYGVEFITIFAEDYVNETTESEKGGSMNE